MSPAKRVKQTTAERMRSIEHLFKPPTKKLVLIRPCKPDDVYTQLGSSNWAAQVKQKAVDEGWQVTDLDANQASREQIEAAIVIEKPTLVIHYDHGSQFTLWGQESDLLEPGLDDQNIAIVSGRMLSTVSCLSARGLGPLAITNGVTAYLGYTDLHAFVSPYADQFGQASNAANFALLEGRTAQEAFDIGWKAYDQLYEALLDKQDFAASIAAPWALHDRDCLTLLGSPSATAFPQYVVVCRYPPDSIVQCMIGIPDHILHCRSAQPDQSVHCVFGNPDQMVAVCRELPDLAVCGRGPDACTAGPPLHIRDVLDRISRDLVVIDRSKVPQDMRKAFDGLLDAMKREK